MSQLFCDFYFYMGCMTSFYTAIWGAMNGNKLKASPFDVFFASLISGLVWPIALALEVLEPSECPDVKTTKRTKR